MSYGHSFKKKTSSEEELEKEYGRTWIWTAMDTNSRLIISHLIGDRTLLSCYEMIFDLKARITNIPLFVSDELPHYQTALTEAYHNLKTFPATNKPGRPKKPVKEVIPELDYAVVHKTRENGKIINVEQRIVYGNEQRIKERLKNCPSSNINTSYIERSNLTLRQNNANLQRKTLKFAKEMNFLKSKVSITLVHYNFIKLHSSLTIKNGAVKTLRTPAMAAKISNKVWTIKYAFEYPFLN